MAEVNWIKITTGIFDDEKIKLIDDLPESDAIFVIWIKLLILAGKVNENGALYLNEDIPYTDEMLATIFHRPLNTVRLALETFQQFKMIEIRQAVIQIVNWEKHQNIEGLDKIREQNRLRQQKHRQKQIENVTVTLSNVTVTEQTRIDKTRLEKNKKEQKHKYGEYSHVLLTDIEYQKIHEKTGDVKKWIRILDEGIHLKAYKYSSHYLAILKWFKKDNPEATARKRSTLIPVAPLTKEESEESARQAAELAHKYR